MLLLLVFMVWLPVSAAGTREGASGLAAPVTVTVQTTPTEDATVTALNKEKLTQEIDQLKNQNYWAWTTIGPILVGFAGLLAALYSFITWTRNRRDEEKKQRVDRKLEQEKQDQEQQRWLDDRRDEREKRAEERFQKVVEGLGSEREEAKVGAAIMLRTFLQKGYEQFHSQTLDLAVVNLQLQHHADQSTSQPPNSLGQVLTAIFTTAQPQSQQQASQNTLQPPDPLSQALITVFKESFPLVREQLRERLKKQGSWFSPQLLDATAIQLDKAYLRGCDLKEAWMPNASLREADLRSTGLAETNLEGANLTRASLNTAILTKANLINVTFTGAVLEWAELDDTILDGANLTGANLTGANLTRASLTDANLTDANLTDADLTDADLTDADLSGANPEAAKSLLGTKMQGVNGLTNDQRKCCVAKRAFVEDVAGDPDQLSIPNTS